MAYTWAAPPLEDYDIEQLPPLKRAAIPDPEPKLARYELGEPPIPVCEPDISEEELQAMLVVVRSGWVSSKSRVVSEFEESFSAAVGAKYGCAVNSGTSALSLALQAAGVSKNQRVIMPTFTMIATAFAANYQGAKPWFCDVNTDGNMNFADARERARVEELDTLKVGAVVPVHMYGKPCDIDAAVQFARDYDAPLIFDAAEAHGATYKGRPIGGYGLASAYSFYGNKNITTAEGGMVVSNNEEYIKLCRKLRDMAFSEERHFWHKHLGHNYRMTGMQAALGVIQTKRMEELVRRRRVNRGHYAELLRGTPGVRFQPRSLGVKSADWMVGIEIAPESFGMTRCELRRYLADKGVETRCYFIPMHLQPYYYKAWKTEDFPVSEALSSCGLYLPSSSKLTSKQRERVAEAIISAYEESA